MQFRTLWNNDHNIISEGSEIHSEIDNFRRKILWISISEGFLLTCKLAFSGSGQNYWQTMSIDGDTKKAAIIDWTNRNLNAAIQWEKNFLKMYLTVKCLLTLKSTKIIYTYPLALNRKKNICILKTLFLVWNRNCIFSLFKGVSILTHRQSRLKWEGERDQA